MKKMKKKVSVLLIVAAMAMTLAGCGKFECGLCGKEKSGKSYKYEAFGVEMTICKDCQEDVQDIKDMFGGN